jgi:TFIIF-interacting CTD phosphatase-like protein
VARFTGGTLEDPSNASWDVLTPEGEKLQVKARIVSDGQNRGQRQLSTFRSFTFDAAIVVLFDDDCAVWKAWRVPVTVVEERARRAEHVGGYTLFAVDELSKVTGVADWTERLRRVRVEG